MTAELKMLCNRIEYLMSLYNENKHDLLYEKTMSELGSLDYNALFMKINNLPLYRIRINEEENDSVFVETKELYYPPPKAVCNYGRVNKPRQSMFYCSEFSSICELELLYDYLDNYDIGNKKSATYSEWEIKQDLNLLVLAIAPTNREYSNGFAIRNKCFEFIKSDHKVARHTYDNLYSLTSYFFLKNAKEDYSVYIVCSAIANFFTLKFPNIDGIIYPSVQGDTGYNIVLRPHVLDKKKIIPKAEVSMKEWIVSNENLMTINSSFLKMGQINGSKIIWPN